MYPIISGNLVVWQDNRNGDFDVYVKDLVSGNETKLTGDGDQVYPDISGNTIAWEDAKSKDICLLLLGQEVGQDLSPARRADESRGIGKVHRLC